jgi:hypothetical protein
MTHTSPSLAKLTAWGTSTVSTVWLPVYLVIGCCQAIGTVGSLSEGAEFLVIRQSYAKFAETRQSRSGRTVGFSGRRPNSLRIIATKINANF